MVHAPVHVRLTLKSINETDVVDYFTKTYPGKDMLIVKEQPTLNPHVHVIIHADSSDSSVRNKISRNWKDLPKEHKMVGYVHSAEKPDSSLKRGINYVCKALFLEKTIVHRQKPMEPSIFIYGTNDYADESFRRLHFLDYWNIDKQTKIDKRKINTTEEIVNTYKCIHKPEVIRGIPHPCTTCPRKHILSIYRNHIKGIDSSIYSRMYYALLNRHYTEYFEQHVVPSWI